jgi:NADPH:quinone reductase-like Zn-dependent oxidoreductase
MKAVHIAKYGRFPVLEHLPIPNLGTNDLLIKMKYAPINPSDLFFYQGKYAIIKSGYPIVGF